LSVPELDNRIVLVSGASGNLGTEVTKAFLSAGATVGGVARAWKGRGSRHERFVPVEADLSSASGVSLAVESVLSIGRRLDAVVHLMGGFAGGTPLQETDDEVWDRMMTLNARPAFLLFKKALPPMLRAGNGRLIAIGSRAGEQPSPTFTAYSASKAALHALVRSIAAETRNSGVTANIILPSTIDTPENRAAMPEQDPSRWVRPESIAGLVRWLASDASADVNGALIPIYGRA
jgi:NAD(P)-dependent dehydrogenase (short-subunit alcohol dehydrogenase family)